jgi:hypothetical protein
MCLRSFLPVMQRPAQVLMGRRAVPQRSPGRSKDEVGSQCSMPNEATASGYLVDLVKLSCAISKEEHL